MNNRALEFLQETERIMTGLNYTRKDAIFTLVQMARGEVEELLDRLGELEAQHAAAALPQHSDGRGVLIVDAMTPAKLTEAPRTLQMLEWLQRKALPGNGKL